MSNMIKSLTFESNERCSRSLRDARRLSPPIAPARGMERE